jgi:thiol-disulfide isomerase/thioredoxin
MMDSKNLLEKTLSTELFWKFNIHYVNTHLMHLSERDVQQVADFEMSRTEQPEAGRLMAEAIHLGGLSQDAKVKWSTWVLEKMPPNSEGYLLVSARNLAKTDIGKVIDFKGVDLDGNALDLKDFRGKVVLVEHWALWCGCCLQEIPEIKAVYHEYYDKGFRVIGVFSDHRFDELKTYIKDKQIQWPQLINPDASKTSYFHPLARKYGILSLPCYLLIDKGGKLIRVGGRMENLRPVIVELLK